VTEVGGLEGAAGGGSVFGAEENAEVLGEVEVAEDVLGVEEVAEGEGWGFGDG
jgi:hypothetical protein